MPHGKTNRYDMWMEGNDPFPPEISRLLPTVILELALSEDVTGPWASEVVAHKYIADLVPRLREPVARALSDAGIAVSEEKLGRICQVSASETFVIRRLNEARIEGELLVQDFCHLPLYRIYREYFEQSPAIVAKAFGIAINTAASDLAARCDADKN